MSAHNNAPAKCWGATQQEWQAAINAFGVERLLPVVSNPEATISPQSKMQALGKTPSWYNAQRQVVGIAGWTEKVATEAEIAKWREEPDYGICVKTGDGLYGFDIDVEDEATAFAYANQLTTALRFDHFVCRYRDNSGRLLVPIPVSKSREEAFKRYRSFSVPGGSIDLLGDGKQFIAFGTHPSGARYKWCLAVNCEGAHFAELRQQFDGSDLV